MNISQTNTKVLYTILLSAMLTLGSCGKDSTTTYITTPPINTTVDPPQYGTPFTEVPDSHDAIIYQVNMRVFSSSRNFQGVTARLDSIKNLGINVIYLMPIYPVGALKGVNSPYCVKDYKGVNSEFGTLTDLRNLIDAAHTKGMTVILDWVANHTAWDNPWTSNKSWYVLDNSGNITSPNGWNDVAQLNFKNTEMRLAMIKAMQYWVLTANCDGFRCDYADGPPADFWKQAIDTLRNIKTHKLLMLAEGSRSDLYSSGFNYTFGFRFYEQLKSVFGNNQPTTNFDAVNVLDYTGASADNDVVRYTTNHDVNSSDGTPLDLFGGSSGSMAAFVVAAYMKGVPMIYNGQEVGLNYRLNFPFTGTIINWNNNPSTIAEYKRILSVRKNCSALRKGTVTTYSSANVCAFTRTLANESVWVVVNLRNYTNNYTLPTGIAGTTWVDAFSGNSVTLGSQLSLAPYSYLVYKR